MICCLQMRDVTLLCRYTLTEQSTSKIFKTALKVLLLTATVLCSFMLIYDNHRQCHEPWLHCYACTTKLPGIRDHTIYSQVTFSKGGVAPAGERSYDLTIHCNTLSYELC